MYANAYTYVPWLLFSSIQTWRLDQDTLLSNLTLHRAGPGDKGHRHHRCHCCHRFHLHRHQATIHAVFLGSFLLLASTPSEFISSIMSFPWPCTVGRINYVWRDLGGRRSTFSTIAGLVKDNNKGFGWLGYFWQLQTGGGKHTDQEEHQQTQPGCDRLRCQPFSYQLQFWTYGEFWNSKFSAQITLKAV